MMCVKQLCEITSSFVFVLEFSEIVMVIPPLCFSLMYLYFLNCPVLFFVTFFVEIAKIVLY